MKLTKYPYQKSILVVFILFSLFFPAVVHGNGYEFVSSRKFSLGDRVCYVSVVQNIAGGVAGFQHIAGEKDVVLRGCFEGYIYWFLAHALESQGVHPKSDYFVDTTIDKIQIDEEANLANIEVTCKWKSGAVSRYLISTNGTAKGTLVREISSAKIKPRKFVFSLGEAKCKLVVIEGIHGTGQDLILKGCEEAQQVPADKRERYVVWHLSDRLIFENLLTRDEKLISISLEKVRVRPATGKAEIEVTCRKSSDQTIRVVVITDGTRRGTHIAEYNVIFTKKGAQVENYTESEHKPQTESTFPTKKRTQVPKSITINSPSDAAKALVNISNRLEIPQLCMAIGLGSCKFQIVQDDEENAWVKIGEGTIYITTGLLNNTKTEDELAFIVAHELGHIYHRHPQKRLKTVIGTEVAARVAELIIKGKKSRQTAEDIKEALQASYSREQEREADQFAVMKLIEAGYDPLKAVDFFWRVLEKERQYRAALDAQKLRMELELSQLKRELDYFLTLCKQYTNVYKVSKTYDNWRKLSYYCGIYNNKVRYYNTKVEEYRQFMRSYEKVKSPYFQTHPLTEERISAIINMTKEYKGQ